MSRVFPALSMFYGGEIGAKHAMQCITHLKSEDIVRIAIVKKSNGQPRVNRANILATLYPKSPAQFQYTPFPTYYDNFSLFDGVILKDITDSFYIAVSDNLDIIPHYSYARMASGKLALGSEFKSNHNILRRIHAKWSALGYHGGLNIIDFQIISSNTFITHIIKGHRSK